MVAQQRYQGSVHRVPSLREENKLLIENKIGIQAKEKEKKPPPRKRIRTVCRILQWNSNRRNRQEESENFTGKAGKSDFPSSGGRIWWCCDQLRSAVLRQSLANVVKDESSNFSLVVLLPSDPPKRVTHQMFH